MRRAARVDDNQKEIVDALRSIPGVMVAITSHVGQGFPDLILSAKGVNVLLEVKDGNKPPSKRKLTPAEQKFHDEWRGWIEIVESVDDALKIVQQIMDVNRGV